MKKIASVLAAGMAGALVSAPAFAEETTNQLVAPAYIGILGGYTFADDERGNENLDYATGIRLFYGSKPQDSAWGYEVGGFFDNFETDKSAGVDYYRSGLNVDLTYSFGSRAEFTPFFLVGAAAAYNDTLPDTEDDWSWMANAGVGFVTGPVTKVGQIRIRGEARYVYDDFLDGYGEPQVNLGIEIPLFEERVVEVAATETVQTVEVPTGLTDTDGDGVIDEKDKCPDTPAGTRVDGDGCPLTGTIELKGVTFEFNKTRLRPDAETILDLATAILVKYPDMNVEVAGHTDNIGSDEYNQKLSEGRAQSVKDYFVAKGIPDTQVSVKGYGEAEPRDTNDTEEGRERNRRVELRILN